MLWHVNVIEAIVVAVVAAIAVAVALAQLVAAVVDWWRLAAGDLRAWWRRRRR